MRSVPPVSRVRLSGTNATDHTGSPGPTSVRASLRLARSITATEPRMPAAATSAPSRESASAINGVGEACTCRSRGPPHRGNTPRRSRAAATISPSGATATAESGAGSVTMVAGAPSSGQTRSVRS